MYKYSLAKPNQAKHRNAKSILFAPNAFKDFTWGRDSKLGKVGVVGVR